MATELDLDDVAQYSPLAQKELAGLRAELANLNRQVLVRPPEAPEWAVAWYKDEGGNCLWLIDDSTPVGDWIDNAPDYRFEQEGEITLVIVEPPE